MREISEKHGAQQTIDILGKFQSVLASVATCSTNTMDVFIDIRWHVVVDNVFYVGNIQASCCNLQSNSGSIS